jgi:DNA-damage-inducible protein D
MTQDRGDIEKVFGLEMPLEEALDRFAKATTEEILDADRLPETELIPEGQAQNVLFKGHDIRKVFHDGEWWFSVVDVVEAITESPRARKYWSDLKRQIIEKEGGSELSAKIGQLKMPSDDGKDYVTDAATAETLFRIIQSIRSPRAEPFKRWLAKVGYERIQEIQNPEIAIKRAIMTYQIQGRSDDWIEKRIRSIVTRKELTGEWRRRGIKEGQEYAVLTNVISTRTFGLDNQGHKRVKSLKKNDNLRDHMTDLELIFTMLGEKSTTEIARTRNAQGYNQNAEAARAGGSVAGLARIQLEKETREGVVSRQNFLGPQKRTADPEMLTAPKSPKR